MVRKVGLPPLFGRHEPLKELVTLNQFAIRLRVS